MAIPVPIIAAAIGAGGMAYASNQQSKAAKSVANASLEAQRNVGNEVRDTMNAQIQAAPGIYAMEERYRPQYADLDRRIMHENLFGNQAAPGMLDMIQRATNELEPWNQQLNDQQRRADIESAERYGPRVQGLVRDLNPEMYGNMDAMDARARAGLGSAISSEMEQQALAGLQNRGLSDDDRRMAVEDARAGWSDRGMLHSGGSVGAEVMQLSSTRRMLEDRARNFAGNVEGQRLQRSGMEFGQLQQATGNRIATQFDPFVGVLGRTSVNQIGAQGQQQAAAGINQTASGMFDPFNPYASQLYGANASARLQGGLAQGQLHGNIAGGMYGLLGQLGGAAIGNWGP